MAFVERVKGVVRRRVLDEWAAQFFERGAHAAVYHYAYEFVVSGCIGMLQYWMERDMPLSAREMAAMMESFIARGVTGL